VGDDLRVAVLGLGSAGRRHVEDFEALGHEVVGFDPAAEGAMSADEAIESADAVVVASPSSFHAEQALRTIERGRHVLVEKPLATDVEAAAAIVEAAAGSGLSCGVAMNLRFHPGVETLRGLVTDGTLGDVYLARSSFGFDLRRWRPQDDYRESYSARSELGGGIVLDAIHELDYLLWLLGPVVSVVAETGHLSALDVDVEDTAVAVLRFAAGAVAAVDLNFWEPSYRRGCTLSGSRGAATWDWNRGTIELDDGERRVLEVPADVRDTYRAEVADFLEAIEQGRSPRTSVADGLAAVRLAQAVKSSARDGRRVAV
jgi:predicted dehydrogenase